MLRAVALRLESGTITWVSTPSSPSSARRSACRPSAPIPSSLVSNTRIRFDSRVAPAAQSRHGARRRDPHDRPFHARRGALPPAAELASGGGGVRRTPLPRFATPPAVQFRGAERDARGGRDLLRMVRRGAGWATPLPARFPEYRLACGGVPRLRRPHEERGVHGWYRAARGARGTAPCGDHVRGGGLAPLSPKVDLRRALGSRLAGGTHQARRRARASRATAVRRPRGIRPRISADRAILPLTFPIRVP